MNNKEFLSAVELLEKEKGIDREIIFEAMELALTSAYKKHFNSLSNVRVDIDKELGDIKVYSFKTVVEEVEDERVELTLKEARKIVPDINIGETIEEEVTTSDFGRVAASTAKQVVVQKIREAERNNIIDEYGDKQEELISGTVSMEDVRNYYIDLGKTQGILPKTEIIPDENIKMGSNIKVYISKVETNPKGPLILLSRSHYGFIKRLFELEIPEINDGTILVYSVAREVGIRTKIAVFSENPNVDPVGSCIGEKGMRINQILKEVGNEKIDVIAYDNDPAKFIANALSPAKNVRVFITDEKKREAMVIVDNDNLSLAIGKKGLNVRLAARLTHFKIDVKTYDQAKEEGINIIE
ncbi:MAG: transcription termination factor NusA [Bacilli bacterium]|nr:transcription termination factor NusA [Bacilli bacterium]MDD4809430.1 transcription termination factor NusA [Bacilli bacterium]